MFFEGISKCLPAYCKDDTPTACWDDIPAEDKDAAMMYAKAMGEVALDILGKSKSCWRLASSEVMSCDIDVSFGFRFHRQ